MVRKKQKETATVLIKIPKRVRRELLSLRIEVYEPIWRVIDRLLKDRVGKNDE